MAKSDPPFTRVVTLTVETWRGLWEDLARYSPIKPDSMIKSWNQTKNTMVRQYISNDRGMIEIPTRLPWRSSEEKDSIDIDADFYETLEQMKFIHKREDVDRIFGL